MKIDIVNTSKETVGSLDLRDEVFGGRVKTDLIWESVVQENAAERRGTHHTKNRAAVSGSGKKPWRQKGTGRARVGEIRNPLWRKGGTVFGPMPRSYEYSLPRKVRLGALRAALAAKLADGTLVVVDTLAAGRDAENAKKTKTTAAMFKTLGASGKTLVIDVTHDEGFARSARNIAGVRLVPSSRVTARDIMDTDHVVATKAALEKLQESLA
jgi:large subunit ribosomal protein L4